LTGGYQEDDQADGVLCCEQMAEGPLLLLLQGAVTLSLSAGVLRTVGSFMPEVGRLGSISHKTHKHSSHNVGCMDAWHP
jgi:hypothetical protein